MKKTAPLLAALLSLLLALALPVAAAAAPQIGAPRVDARVDGDRLHLTLEDHAHWQEAGVERLAVRSAEGLRYVPTLDAERQALAEKSLAVDLGNGCAMTRIDFLKEGAQHRLRLATCHENATFRDRLAAGESMTDKVGGPVELRPAINLALLVAGSDLPLRVYVDSSQRSGARVVAEGPDGARSEGTSDSVGLVTLRISKEGPWTVRFAANGHSTELRFTANAADAFTGHSLTSAPKSDGAPRAALKIAGWRELGPGPLVGGPNARHAGRASGIAVSEVRRNRYYVAAASGGIWESLDGGGEWTFLSASLPTLATGAIALDPKNDKIIYAGSGEGNYAYHSLYGLGLYRSTNRGQTWQVLAPEVFSGRTFSRLVVSPHNSRDIWAAVTRAGGTFEGFEGARNHPQGRGATGLFRSRDSGRTWQMLGNAQGLPPFIATDIDLDPTDPRRVYASFGDPFGHARNGVYRSTDGGRTFQPVLRSHDLRRRIGRVVVALAPSDPNRLYALTVAPAEKTTTGGFLPPGSSTEALYRSDDGGSNWTRLPVQNFQGQQGDYNTIIAVAPNDPDTVILGGVNMLRTRDGGSTFQDITPPHVDIHDLAFDAIGRLVVANDGGINRSWDMGDTWETRNEGLTTVQIYPGLDLHPTDRQVMLMGMQDNGTNLRTDNALAWLQVFGGDGGYSAFHPDDPSTLFVQFQGIGNLFQLDANFAFTEISNGIALADRTAFQAPFVIDPENPSRMLYATQRIYESTNNGANWNIISGDLTTGSPWAIRSLVLAPSNSNIVWASTNDGRVLVSSNGGAEWTLVRENVAGWPRIMRQIAVDPLRPSQAYVADMRFGGDKVLVTLDRGATWSSLRQGLPNVPVNTVAIHREGTTRWIFAGTDQGVWVKRNFSGAWEELGRLPHVPVMDLVVDTRFNRLVAATLGRGAWEIGLPSE